ncbi:hypothetical protein Tco_0783161 [Tanacetum coccineum]
MAIMWFDSPRPPDHSFRETFKERFKVETGRMKGAPECMRISGFMHGVNNPELTKRLNEHVPKTMEKMMTATTAFIRGETAAASKKKGHTSWKLQDQPKRHVSERKSDYRDMHKPHYSEDYQNTAREDFPVEVATPPLAPTQPKPSRRCQNRPTQNEEAPCCTAWTNKEEIALCKGWIHEMEYDAPERGSVLWSAHYIMHRAQESVARDEDYYATTVVDCEAEFGVPFLLLL